MYRHRSNRKYSRDVIITCRRNSRKCIYGKGFSDRISFYIQVSVNELYLYHELFISLFNSGQLLTETIIIIE